jgi:hypothetical protein
VITVYVVFSAVSCLEKYGSSGTVFPKLSYGAACCAPWPLCSVLCSTLLKLTKTNIEPSTLLGKRKRWFDVSTNYRRRVNEENKDVTYASFVCATLLEVFHDCPVSYGDWRREDRKKAREKSEIEQEVGVHLSLVVM